MQVKFASFDTFFAELHSRVNTDWFVQGTVSQPRTKTNDVKRVKMKIVSLNQIMHIQFEYHYDNKVSHANIPLGQID